MKPPGTRSNLIIISQLFMPYRCDIDLKPSAYVTYELFYSCGILKSVDGLLHSVKSVVDKNCCLLGRDAETLDSIHNSIDNQGVLEDTWCEMCPEQQLDRLEYVELASSAQQADETASLTLGRAQGPRWRKKGAL